MVQLLLLFHFSLNLLFILCALSSHFGLVKIVNRVAVVELVSTARSAGGGIDIVATVRDASGVPVTGRALSCWIRSTCGLVRDMVPGWVDTYAWLSIKENMDRGVPGFRGEAASMSELYLPSYCSGAGYPKYVRPSNLSFSSYCQTKLNRFLLRSLTCIKLQTAHTCSPSSFTISDRSQDYPSFFLRKRLREFSMLQIPFLCPHLTQSQTNLCRRCSSGCNQPVYLDHKALYLSKECELTGIFLGRGRYSVALMES